MKLKRAGEIGARHWPAEKMEEGNSANNGIRPDSLSAEAACGSVIPGGSRRRGYTLIEFIGVLAIMAVLASMLLPVILNDVESQYVATETANLSTIQSALQFEITHTFQIPNETNWASTISSWLMLPTVNITSNGRGYSRAYVYDTNGFGGLALPYTQVNGLGVVPGNPRLMIVSSISSSLPIPSGGMSSNDFTAIWNAAPGTTPSTWTTNWHGNPGDLVIQRINLQPLFCRVVLNAIDTNDFGSVQIQSGASTNLSPLMCILTNSLNLTNTLNNSVATVLNLTSGILQGAGTALLSGPASTTSSSQAFTAWYIQGSVVDFYDTNKSPSLTNLESQLIVQSDCSFVFEDQAWRGLLSGWGTNGPGLLSTVTGISGSAGAAAVCTAYTVTDLAFKTCGLNANDWGGASRGDSCQTMSACFNSMMMDYNNWCQEGFGTGSDNSCSKVNSDVQRIYNITQNMCQ